MDSSSILSLTQNAALLLAMLFFYDVFTRFWSTKESSIRAVPVGFAVGLIGVVIMLTPWHFQSGIMFDTRSVLLSISGLFLGVIPTVIAMVVTATLRVYLGGAGVLVGVVIILTSGFIGIGWRYFLHKSAIHKITAKELYLFGFVVHVAMLGGICLFPWDVAVQILADITLPVLIVFPIVTVGLGALFTSRLKQDQSDLALLKSEERLRSLYFHAPVALWEEDWSGVRQALLELKQAGINDISAYLRENVAEAQRIISRVTILDVNDAALKQSGAMSKKELLSRRTQFFHASSIEDFIDVTSAFSQGLCVYTCESPFIRLDGEQRLLEVRHVVMPGHEKALDVVIITTMDITERKLAEDSMQLASSVYQNSSEAMTVSDAAGNIINVNPAFTEVTGYTLAEIIGKSHKVLQSGHHDSSFYQSMWEEINSTGRWKGEIRNRRKNGEVYDEWLTINTILNSDGEAHRRVALFSDISQEKKLEGLVWQETNFDALTGLPNRRMFLDRLAQDIKKTHYCGLTGALLVVDLDRFKAVNDSLGYEAGDSLIRDTANRLQACVRDSDTVARIGGDEFTIILSELDDVNSIEQITQTVLTAMVKPFQIGGQSIYLSCSIGIASFPGDASNADKLIQCADQAMNVAKSQGRNRRNYFTPAMQESVQNKIFLVNELRNALAGNQFSVYYQPIVDLSNDAVYKAEALIRWQHPVRGFVSPAEFIPVAEETGLIIEIGNWVFRQAAAQVKSWRNSLHADFQISVNKSPVQFHSESNDLYEWFDFLHQQAVSGSAIIIEVTEGLMMNSGVDVSSKLFACNDAGMQVALDDFGTGYSSLSYLKKFDIDYLKIDQSFVKNLENDVDNVALCESMIAMAHKLGIKVIAEGVETRQQRDLLKAWGCDYAQGYLYSKPLPADDFEKLFTDKNVKLIGCEE